MWLPTRSYISDALLFEMIIQKFDIMFAATNLSLVQRDDPYLTLFT